MKTTLSIYSCREYENCVENQKGQQTVDIEPAMAKLLTNAPACPAGINNGKRPLILLRSGPPSELTMVKVGFTRLSYPVAPIYCRKMGSRITSLSRGIYLPGIASLLSVEWFPLAIVTANRFCKVRNPPKHLSVSASSRLETNLPGSMNNTVIKRVDLKPRKGGVTLPRSVIAELLTMRQTS